MGPTSQKMKQQQLPQHYAAPDDLYDAESASSSKSRWTHSCNASLIPIIWRLIGGIAILELLLVLSGNVSVQSLVRSSHSSAIDKVLSQCSAAGVHPIACKVDHAAALASQLKSRQSTTVEQAVLTYRHRYRRIPPPGFDKWAAFALEHNSTIIDDFDQIEFDLSTFRRNGLVGHKLKARMIEAKAVSPGYDLGHVSVVGGQAVTFGPDFGPLSVSALNSILQPVQHLIPDVTILFNWFAEPRVPHPSAATSMEPLHSVPTRGKETVPWLHDPCGSKQASSMQTWTSLAPPFDSCREDVEEVKSLHGFFQGPSNFHPFNKLVPMLSRAKMSSFADVLAPNVCYGASVYRGFPDAIPWEKKLDSIYWRGTTTGIHENTTAWAGGHRHRMMRYVKQLREAANKLNTGVEQDPIETLYGANRTISPSRASVHVAGNALPLFDYTDVPVAEALKRLGPATFNVSWSNFLPADNETMASLLANFVATGIEDRNWLYRHKFLLDLDGQSMSCRYYQLLASNSLVFKQTIWSEYHDERLVPWIHYVPLDLRIESNELPLALDFFINHPQGPSTAKKIATASKEWAEVALRPLDASIYYARLLIEFAALLNQ